MKQSVVSIAFSLNVEFVLRGTYDENKQTCSQASWVFFFGTK